MRPQPRGSPPRMRGKVRGRGFHCPTSGITPAYAGKRNFWRLRCGSMWDHPRVCGEKFPGWELQKCVVGSPPRMRGKAGTESSTPTSARITPAYAGKRNGQSPTMLLRRDHPRVCGEKNAILSGRKTEPGSPPRMRGKEHVQRCVLRTLQDHPRVCGEKLSRRVST